VSSSALNAPADGAAQDAGGAQDAGHERVGAAAAELYGADPQEFTERRKELAAAARAAGDTAAAKQISALRKPTRAAWVVNQLARAGPGARDRLAALGAALREAERAKNGPRLRELSAGRGPLIDELTGQALAVAGVTDTPAGLREDVEATLTAVLADPDVAAEFAAGTLTRAAQWAGFGAASFGPVPDNDVPDDADGPALPVPDGPPVPKAERGSAAPLPARPGQSAARRTQAAPPAQAAEEAARQAARRREIFDDAERTVASAAAATAAAVAAEDWLEAEVRSLEERLTRARTDLADARRRARNAEAAERKARQTLDRLPRP